MAGNRGGTRFVVGAQHAAPLPQQSDTTLPGRPGNIASGSLGAIVRSFKSAVTKRINEARGTPGVRLWQRGYYDRIIADEKELYLVRRYIRENLTNGNYDGSRTP